MLDGKISAVCCCDDTKQVNWLSTISFDALLQIKIYLHTLSVTALKQLFAVMNPTQIWYSRQIVSLQPTALRYNWITPYMTHSDPTGNPDLWLKLDTTFMWSIVTGYKSWVPHSPETKQKVFMVIDIFDFVLCMINNEFWHLSIYQWLDDH